MHDDRTAAVIESSKTVKQRRGRRHAAPRAVVCAAALCLVMAGCGTKPTLLRADLQAAADVNPDGNGRASPIVVRLYELKTPSGFDSADFFSLWDKDAATLGPDMAARDEYLMKPGEQRKIERSPQSGVTFIGVVAAFRDIERARWRATVPVPANQTTDVVIKLEPRSIAMTAKKD